MPGCRLLCLFCLALPVAAAPSYGDQSGSTASWRQGVSRWNGQGYTVPESTTPAPAARPANPNSPSTPYTVPVDPAAAATRPTFELSQRPNRQPPRSSSDKSYVPLSDPSAKRLSDDSLPAVIDELQLEQPAGDFPSALSTDSESIETLPTPDEDDTATSDRIADTLAEAETSEEPPLQEEVLQWYQYSKQWMQGWDSHAEFGLDGSSGNADTLALQTGLEMKRKSKHSIFALDVDYRQASNRNRTVEDNGRFNLDYDYIFKESSWAGFTKYGMEWDKFKAFDLRLNFNGGVGYYWLREEHASFVSRFGAGASKEIGAPDDDWVPEAVFGLEGERQLTERQKIKGKVDYFPAWQNFNDFRLVTDLSWEILLDNSDNLSLKLSVTDRYDSTPQGAEPNDVYYSMLLLYKF